jgi:hypothetical protein
LGIAEKNAKTQINIKNFETKAAFTRAISQSAEFQHKFWRENDQKDGRILHHSNKSLLMAVVKSKQNKTFVESRGESLAANCLKWNNVI